MTRIFSYRRHAGKYANDTLLVVNPLKNALHHYVSALSDNLESAGYESVVDSTMSIEGLSRMKKFGAIGRILMWRLCSRPSKYLRTIVVWPSFGMVDILTWALWSVRCPVSIILHDVTPLRKSSGYWKGFAGLVRTALKLFPIDIICHTQLASEELNRRWGIAATVVPHPISVKFFTNAEKTRGVTAIRVLGQYKPARAIDPLLSLASSIGPRDSWQFEIIGRSWPRVAGWHVNDEFVDEAVFSNLISTADCVIVPYTFFYQSGVATRALESAVPVVAPRHPHIEELYGHDWPGLVDNDDWLAAVQRALAVSTEEVEQRALSVAAQVAVEWGRYMCGRLPSNVSVKMSSGDKI